MYPKIKLSDESEDIKIIGKVVWHGRSFGME